MTFPREFTGGDYTAKVQFTILTKVEVLPDGEYYRAELANGEPYAYARDENMARALCLEKVVEMFKERSRECRSSS